MKKTVLLTLFLSFMGLFANAQCTYLNEDFEDWSTFPMEFQGVERDIMTPDNHVSFLRFFVNFLLIEFFNDPDAFDLFQNDPQGFWESVRAPMRLRGIMP
jgi:hypothetical protein